MPSSGHLGHNASTWYICIYKQNTVNNWWLQKWLRGYKHLLLMQRTQVQLPEPTTTISEPPITPFPEDPMSFANLHKKHTFMHIIKLLKEIQMFHRRMENKWNFVSKRNKSENIKDKCQQISELDTLGNHTILDATMNTYGLLC